MAHGLGEESNALCGAASEARRERLLITDCVLLPTDPSVGLRKEIATSRFDKPEMNSTASRRSRTEFSTE